MNDKNNGRCWTIDEDEDEDEEGKGKGGGNYYKIGTDAEDNNIVTGEGKL